MLYVVQCTLHNKRVRRDGEWEWKWKGMMAMMVAAMLLRWHTLWRAEATLFEIAWMDRWMNGQSHQSSLRICQIGEQNFFPGG